MHFTETSILLAFSCVFAFAPGAQLFMVRYFGIIGGGAIVVLGSLGVATPLAPTMLFIGNVLLQMLLGKHYAGRQRVNQIAGPFVVAALYAIATSLILPFVFDNAVDVWPSTAETFFGEAIPLHFGISNITHTLYLAVDLAFFLCAAWFLAGDGADLKKHFWAYLASGYIIGFICLWQFASRVAGVPFPEDFFYSNPSWAQLSDQAFGGIPRINGPFTEPASLATNVCGFVFCTGWLLLQGYRHRALLPLFLLSLLCILLSTSTSGFAGLAGGLAYVLLRTLAASSAAFKARIAKVALIGAGLAAVIVVSVPVFAPGIAASVGEIAALTIDKPNSFSYDQRTQMDTDSFTILLDTFGLGAGYGSNRPSSLIPSLLSQVGVIGMAIIVVFVVRLWQAVARARRLARSRDDRLLLQGYAAAISGVLFVSIISGPGIPSSEFYLTLALLVATVIKIERGAATSRRIMRARGMSLTPAELQHS